MSSKAKKLGKAICKDQSLKATKEISENLLLMGHCSCGAPIFSYLDVADSKDRYNLYCMGKDCGYVSDIRFPRSADQFFMKHPHSPLEMLQAAYKEKGLDITEEIKTAPQSELVGAYFAKKEDQNG